MGTPQDASTLNGVSLGSKYFYQVSSTSLSSSGVNGTNTYSGQVNGYSTTSISGVITDTSSNGNGTFSVTAANNSVTYYQVLGSSSDSQNLVIRQYDPTSGTTSSTFVVSDTGTAPAGAVSFNSNNGYLKPTCFLSGTMILTPRGEVAVEDLAVGDLVVVASGARAIRWIGQRTYACSTYIKPDDVLPILVARDAIAPAVPSRDTYLSNGHALALDAGKGPVLVAVHELVNGTTIRQIAADTVCYWHVELDKHDIVLANALPAESYLESGNRHMFDTAREASPMSANPDRPALRRADLDDIRIMRRQVACRAGALAGPVPVAA